MEGWSNPSGSTERLKAAENVVAWRRRPEGRGRSPSNPSLSANQHRSAQMAATYI
jgi:hypothetical protein